MTIKRTEPTRHLYAGHAYTPAAATDLKALFERIRNAQVPAKAENVKPLKQRSR